MKCPNCAQAMTGKSFPRVYGRGIDLDICDACHAIWFDNQELLQLAPAATMQLLSDIAEHPDVPRNPVTSVLTCPRCARPLETVHDQQRNTKFTYARCPEGHGRFLTFFQFMRAKDFVRPLRAEEVDDLRSRIRQVNCSNCGAPVEIELHSACSHCGAPFAILDPEQVQKAVAQLKAAAEESKQVDPALPLSLAMERERAEQIWAGLSKLLTRF